MSNFDHLDRNNLERAKTTLLNIKFMEIHHLQKIGEKLNSKPSTQALGQEIFKTVDELIKSLDEIEEYLRIDTKDILLVD
jgi:hypothetical protein